METNVPAFLESRRAWIAKVGGQGDA